MYLLQIFADFLGKDLVVALDEDFPEPPAICTNDSRANKRYTTCSTTTNK